MKKIVTSFALTGILCAFALIGLAAENKGKTVKFYTDVMVNGTRVEKGDYQVTFNETSNEISIMKGKDTVAKTTARLEKRDKKARATEYLTADQGNGQALVSITFEGKDEALVIGEGSGAGK